MPKETGSIPAVTEGLHSSQKVIIEIHLLCKSTYWGKEKKQMEEQTRCYNPSKRQGTSPYLSPIEHAWDVIGRHLSALPQPRSQEEIWRMVHSLWSSIPQDTIRTLIASVPRRVDASRGGVRRPTEHPVNAITISRCHLVLHITAVYLWKMANEGNRPSYYIHENGFIMPAGFPKDGFKSSLDYEPDAGDIFVVTYPKCGTTWVQCILYLLLNKGVPIKAGKSINDFIPHLEEVGKDRIRNLSRPRVIKTHLPYHLTPYNTQAKYICITRNPKDCCVSFYHHTTGFPRHYNFLNGKFSDYFDIFLKGEVDFGDYFDHLLSWISHKDDQNVLFLLYEEMKEDTEESIKRIGEFLGSPFTESCNNNNIFNLVLQHSNIEAMKEIPDAWSSERPAGTASFIRKGAVGDWRNYFSKEQAQRLNDKFREKFKGTAAEHLWDKFDC